MNYTLGAHSITPGCGSQCCVGMFTNTLYSTKCLAFKASRDPLRACAQRWKYASSPQPRSHMSAFGLVIFSKVFRSNRILSSCNLCPAHIFRVFPCNAAGMCRPSFRSDSGKPSYPKRATAARSRTYRIGQTSQRSFPLYRKRIFASKTIRGSINWACR